MSKGIIAALCIFCLIMSGIIITGGYKSYDEYKVNKSYADIGKDILSGTDSSINDMNNKIDDIKNFNIGKMIEDGLINLSNEITDNFAKLWIRIKEAFKEIFDWIPGVDIDNNDTNDDDFGRNGNGFGVPSYDGYGGGGGGAR